MNPYDTRHPEYQKELGFRPCRWEDCAKGEAVHPWHPGGDARPRLGRPPKKQRRQSTKSTRKPRARSVDFLATIRAKARAARVLPHKIAARDWQIRRLADAGFKPKLEHKTEDGRVLYTEWHCPVCESRGWLSNPCVACQLCHGHASLLATPEEMFGILSRRGLLKD